MKSILSQLLALAAILTIAPAFASGTINSQRNDPGMPTRPPSNGFINVKDYGAKGDGNSDDAPAFSAALRAAKNNGTNIVYAPPPAIKYKLASKIIEQSGVSLQYSPGDILTTSTTRPDKGNQLASIEGVDQDNYVHALAEFLQTPLTQATPRRYWTLYGAVDIPPGATIPPGNVNYDANGVRGQARSRSANSRIWGISAAAQVDQTANNDTQLGSAFGGEFDINNNSGYSITDPQNGADAVATQLAVGSGIAKAALQVSRGGNGQFLSGILFKNGSLQKYGIYFGDVGPTDSVIYISDLYSSGKPVLSVKNLVDALYLRNAASTDSVGRIKGAAASMVTVGGPGTGEGTAGISWSNHADTTTNGFVTDDGTWSLKKYGAMLATNATTGVIENLDVSAGGLIALPNATKVINMTTGVISGREVTLFILNPTGCTIVDTDSRGGTPILLAGHKNAALTQFSSITFFYYLGRWVEKSRSVR